MHQAFIIHPANQHLICSLPCRTTMHRYNNTATRGSGSNRRGKSSRSQDGADRSASTQLKERVATLEEKVVKLEKALEKSKREMEADITWLRKMVESISKRSDDDSGSYPASYEGRVSHAFDIVREVYNDLDEGDKYYFSSVDHFQLKGLYLQATRGNSNATRMWHPNNPTACEHNAHMECHGMSEIEAMEEYVKLALKFEGGSFSEYCYEALAGHPVLGDLGMEEEDDGE